MACVSITLVRFETLPIATATKQIVVEHIVLAGDVEPTLVHTGRQTPPQVSCVSLRFARRSSVGKRGRRSRQSGV
jgi:hypothetical protein